MIYVAFCLSLIAFCLHWFFYSSAIPILPFIPLLAFIALIRPLHSVLLWSFSTGFFLDLISADPFGVHALNHVITAILCYPSKNRFSSEEPLQFGCYTALYSFISTQLQMILLFLFDRRILFEGKWWITQWVLLPLFDALYAMIWFAAPLALLRLSLRFWRHVWYRVRRLN